MAHHRSHAVRADEGWSAWTGTEGYVVGLASDAIPELSVGFRYDRSTDVWTQTDPPGLNGQWLALGRSGSRVVGVDMDAKATVLDAGGSAWSALPSVPFGAGWDWLTVTAVPSSVVVTTGTGGWLLDGATWVPIAGTPPDIRASVVPVRRNRRRSDR